jgi:hypothetical protein
MADKSHKIPFSNRPCPGWAMYPSKLQFLPTLILVTDAKKVYRMLVFIYTMTQLVTQEYSTMIFVQLLYFKEK